MCFLGTLNEKCVQFPVRKIWLYHCTLKWMICFLHNLYLIFARVLRRDGGISWQGGGAEHVRHQLPVMRSQPWDHYVTNIWSPVDDVAVVRPPGGARGGQRGLGGGRARGRGDVHRKQRERDEREGETKRSHWPLLSTQLSLVTTCNLV